MSQNINKISLAVSIFMAYVSLVFFLKLCFSYSDFKENVDLPLIVFLGSFIVLSVISIHLLKKIK